ncbi:hypothetical protein NDU88_005385 [Pleurodeles waltl]|uniref:Uncharacterized protein n=1 Tax=Pleurodeles waltl TaxID=8319 RepID=A0AAV7L2J3_PLEWA|nr:hypothetical protein NDU88_005385 [Pleurodeles waltl]
MEPATLEKQVAATEARSGALEVRVEDLERRACRNNIRLLGFPERAEGMHSEQFVEAWIRDTLKPDGLTPMFAVGKAHQELVEPLRLGAPPRATITRILNYKDRYSVLRAARDTDNARFENRRISIYLDYTTKVQAAQKTFLKVKAKLRSMGLLYMLLCPVRLKVISGGTARFFDTPEDVWQRLEVRDKAPKEHNPAWRNGSQGQAMKASTGSTSETDVPAVP